MTMVTITEVGGIVVTILLTKWAVPLGTLTTGYL